MTKQRLLIHFAHGLRFRLSLALSLTISMVVSMAWAGEVPTQPATTIQPDQPPFALTLAQLKSWSTQSSLAAADNVSQQPLVRRFVAPLARNSSAVVQDHQARVLYAPDGMNNFANYLTAQPKFNLYNFTHWAQIDVLNWFAGTADLTVQIPARPWVDTAHKNGVKVIGSVFLGIAQWGGNPDTVEMLLQQDAEGRFVMAHQLVALAQYYGFDGWLVNQETDLTAVKDKKNQLVPGQRDPKRGAELAARMLNFMQYLTAIAPAGMEIHWYDSMLADGQVRWQNALNDKNQQYLQQGKVASADAIFLNYWWNAAMVQQSAAKASALGRSPYEVFFGADLWPSRDAQRAFSESKWLDWLFTPDGSRAYGSIALFAPNVNFNFSGESHTPAFSNFVSDASDHRRFYQTEQRLFAGDDLNSAVVDSSGWAGLSKFLPAKSVINSLPFRTSFNTGQGLQRFVDGKAINSPAGGNGWTDISQQDVLPSWQFAVFGNAKVQVNYDFEQAWQGGSSLLIEATTAGDADIPLYQTAVRLGASSQLRVLFQPVAGDPVLSATPVQLYLEFSDGRREQIKLVGSPLAGSNWRQLQLSLPQLAGAELVRIGVQWSAPQTPKLRLGLLELLP